MMIDIDEVPTSEAKLLSLVKGVEIEYDFCNRYWVSTYIENDSANDLIFNGMPLTLYGTGYTIEESLKDLYMKIEKVDINDP